MIGAVLGGIGLFLLGMKLLTEGLQALAGDALRDLLARSTRTPASALASGALATALLQSSSAVTLAVIGFVGAGLLSLQGALGVVYGANLGTTATAWLVSLIGLKSRVEAFALPLVGVGAALDLLGRGRRASLGRALAGFGLVFLGIGALRTGMEGFSGALDPGAFALPGFGGRLVLVLVGALSTVVLQSSSAAVTTTLAAVHTGTLTFAEAAAVVVGQNIGTTVTAGLGAIGGGTEARRTSLGHVLFNAITGLVALILLPPFVAVVQWTAHALELHDPAVGLALFHTAFNLVGVLLFVPMTPRFAQLLTRLVPLRRTRLTGALVEAHAGVPLVLLESARRTSLAVAAEIVAVARRTVAGATGGEAVEEQLREAREALVEIRAYLEPLRTDPTTPDEFARHLAILHALDHLGHLAEACADPPVTRVSGALGGLLDTASGWLAGDPAQGLEDLEAAAARIATERRTRRPELLERTARGEIGPRAAEQALAATGWSEDVATRTWRALHHLRAAGDVGEPPLSAVPTP